MSAFEKCQTSDIVPLNSSHVKTRAR